MSRDLRWTLALTATASVMVALDLLIVSTALPVIRADLDVPLELLQWAVTGYGLSFAGLLMTGSALGDRHGRRRVFLIGTLVFTTASALCALAPSAPLLIAARVVQGAGAALILPLAMALLMTATEADARGRMLGRFEGLTGLATISGPVLGGVLADRFGWPSIFWVNVPIGLGLLFLGRRRLAESRGPDAGLDVKGVILVTGSAFGIVLALVHGNSVGWTSTQTVGPLLVGLGLGLAFIVAERRTASPLIPLTLFRRRAFSASMIATVGLFAALYGTVFFAAQFLQSGQGLSAAQTGIRLVPWTATLLVVAPVAGSLCDRVGARPVLVGALLGSTGGLVWLATVAGPDTGYLTLLPPLLLTGIGTSAAIPAAQTALIRSVDESDIGKASGVNNTVQELAGAVGVAAAVAVFNSFGGYESPRTVSDGFRAAILACAVLTLTGMVAALVIPPEPSREMAGATRVEERDRM